MMALQRIAALAEIREMACLHVVARILFLILLHFSAWPRLVVIYPRLLQYKICISKEMTVLVPLRIRTGCRVI